MENIKRGCGREKMWKRETEIEKERQRERDGRGEKGRNGGVKVKLSPLKLVEETASPFWV